MSVEDSASSREHCGMKTCTKCGERKALECFYRDARRPDGLKSQCKTCHMAYRCKPETRRRISKSFYARNRDNYADRWGRYAATYGDALKARKLKEREELSRPYVASLVVQGTQLRASDVPEEVINLKREQVLLLRLAKEMQQEATKEAEQP